jgi:hypothetical protein
MPTAFADDELATPALRRAAAGSTHSSAAASSISSSFLEQAEDVKAKLVVKKKKAKKIEGEDEGAADPFANSRFDGKCKGVTEEDSVNWMFCKVLCSMCENEGECCISKHLGCHSNPSLSHLYEGFLEYFICGRDEGQQICGVTLNS